MNYVHLHNWVLCKGCHQEYCVICHEHRSTVLGSDE